MPRKLPTRDCVLSGRECEILVLYYALFKNDRYTKEELGRRFNVCPTRIGQLLRRIKGRMESAITTEKQYIATLVERGS